jgi:hypothetical protein
MIHVQMWLKPLVFWTLLVRQLKQTVIDISGFFVAFFPEIYQETFSSSNR